MSDQQTDVLDGQGEGGQDYRKGPVSEDGLAFVREVAKRAGWTDRDEWTRDPDKWRDADEYLAETPKVIETLQERLKRTGQAADAAIEEERRRAQVEARAEIRAAAEAQDPEAAEAAAAKLARNSGPPPQTTAWIAKNQWFNTDSEAQAVAVAAVNRGAAAGLSIEDQLEAAEIAVKKRFPEHFPGEARREEVRLSERRPPVVTPGTRTAPPSSREKTFGDIPAGDRAQYQRYFAKRMEGRGLSKAEAEAKYAKTYWAEQGE